MIKWAGIIITLCGIGHTVGSLIEAAPDHAGAWLSGALWRAAYPGMSDAAVAWCYTIYSFGPLLLLLGLTVVWLDRRSVTPPRFIAWGLATWVIVGTVASGPSPLLLLLVAAGLLFGARRCRSGRNDARSPSYGGRRI